MRISKEDVQHVGRLARLHLNEDEVEAFSHQLSVIVNYMDELNKVETHGVDQTASVIDQANVFREDVPKSCLPREKALANGPAVADGFFRVPKILEGR